MGDRKLAREASALVSRLSLAGAFDRRLTIAAYHEEGGRIERLTTGDVERQPLVQPATHWP